MRLLVACAVSWLIGLLCAIALSSLADPLEDFSAGWRAGTALVEDQDYARLYAQTTDRSVTFLRAGRRGDNIAAVYESQVSYAEGPYTERGIVMLWLDGDRIVRADNRRLDGEQWSRATTGQAADVATTAIGLSAGFSETNPLGVAILPIKLIALHWSDGLPFGECVQAKQGIGAAGWGAALWNVGMLAGAPIAGAAVAAVVGLWFGADRDAAWLECAGEIVGTTEETDHE